MTLHFSFRVYNHRRLRQRNLVGDQVIVALVDDGSIGLFGDKDGTVRIVPTDIERIRIGVIEGKRRVFSTKLWFANGDKPIELVPPRAEWPAYSRVVRRWVEMLAAQHQTHRVTLGASKFDALLGPTLFAMLLTGSVLVSIFALGSEPWWGRMLVPLVPAVVFTIFVWISYTRTWPRPMESPEDVRRQLPPA